MRVEAEGSCKSKHNAREEGFVADHASEALRLDASAAGGRGALPHDIALSLTKAAFSPRCEPSAGANCNFFEVSFLRG
jgi:hypothetical protein